jgi:hypothetical protein
MWSFFTLAAVSPRRQRGLRWTVAAHLTLLLACTWWVGQHPTGASTFVSYVLLTAGILEGAVLVGWRLAQLPKSQALEFLLVSPLRPYRVLLGEALVGLTRLAFVTLSGLPILVLFAARGCLESADLGPCLAMPFTWGAITGLGLTVWAYEPVKVRRWAERGMFVGIVLYLIVGVLAGEHLAHWLGWLPGPLGGWCLDSVEAFHRYNPFAVLHFWFEDDSPAATERMLGVESTAVIVVGLLLARSAGRLHGHFHDRHYRPAIERRRGRRGSPGEQPLSWWAVKRVTEYSGRVNLWLAGGFGVLYSLYIVASPHWPSWLGRNVFVMFDRTGGVPLWATALVVLAAVPAAFQYGLWDSNAQDRCRRLELLLLTRLTALDYWRAAARAAWQRGRGYFAVAALLWAAAAIAGALSVGQALAALAVGIVLWGLYFAVGFRAFARGLEANLLGLGLTVGLPILAFFCGQIGWPALATLSPPGALYYAASPTASGWTFGAVLGAVAALVVSRRALATCEAELRSWYDRHHGRKGLD